jgi:lipopolysaccharide biosynthesis regulator YciM
MPLRHRRSRWLVAAFAAAASAGGVARADDGEPVDARLQSFEAEAHRLAADLPRPNQGAAAAGPRRLQDAELAYALGDYDAAALMLFDLATRPGADHDAACFYLAESLFQKGDKGAAAGYYEQVVKGQSVTQRYYQPALQRLVEIAIARKDEAALTEHLVELDRIPVAQRLASVPYVRGKAAYARGKHDEAIAAFGEVPKGSDYELQAAYYLGTTYVGKGDVQRATAVFADLVGRAPRTANDRRMLELSQLALGRLYYERDQPAQSIDAYLMVDRHSDLFPDALYEVSWVYVKSRQYDKALRALELLALSDPQSTKTPTVRILEGNLRIRKAQMIRGAQILGTIDAKEQDDPATEYDRAVQVFTETHDMYAPSYTALARLAEAGTPPERYLAQIAGRSEHVFQAAAPLPEAAVQYLRDEAAVQRVVAVEGDLEEIHADLAGTAATVARLEGVLAAGDRGAVYPALAGRRSRIASIEGQLIQLRNDLAEQQLRLVAGSGELAALSQNRRQRVAAFAQIPDPVRAAETHALQNRARYDAIEQTAEEAASAIGATQAIAVALRKYTADTRDLPAEQTRGVAAGLDAAAREAEAIEDELDRVHRELQIGRDLAAVGDSTAASAAAARAAARSAEDAEHRLLAGMANGRGDAARRLAQLGDRAARLADQLAQTSKTIDGVIDQGLQEVRGALAEAKATLATYQAELAQHEAESRSIGGGVLAASLQAVKARFYDIVIRTDVGNVDVAWSQREDVDDDLKRLNLSRQRELKQLKDEFKDILDAGTAKPSEPARKSDLPPAGTAPDAGSPDKATGDPRVTPGEKPARPEPVKPAAKPARSASTKGGSR